MSLDPFVAPSICPLSSVRIKVKPGVGSGDVMLNHRAEETQRMLEYLLSSHASASLVARYVRCPRVEIDPNAESSYSYPSISLTVKYHASERDRLDRPEFYERQLEQLRSLFIHEQLHWLVGPCSKEINPVLIRLIGHLKELPALADLKPCPDLVKWLGPKAQTGLDLHLVVNWLEYQANISFFGDRERARQLLLEVDSYQAIYRAIIANESSIAKIFAGPGYERFTR